MQGCARNKAKLPCEDKQRKFSWGWSDDNSCYYKKLSVRDRIFLSWRLQDFGTVTAKDFLASSSLYLKNNAYPLRNVGKGETTFLDWMNVKVKYMCKI